MDPFKYTLIEEVSLVIDAIQLKMTADIREICAMDIDMAQMFMTLKDRNFALVKQLQTVHKQLQSKLDQAI